ncbi:TPA: 3-oxoacyl-[acyl-carrier-protein] synthase III C-terminal domain-containing protein [Staphylococcus aureus]|uniref:3-oxoacyl-[acyl-carrier-protein] synthase III C-terminal domain-containing protein n=1 Tax=Staphylococcaceae TaxID=90964 RepID=UPI000448C908|nr:3-oxoacyl-[acyl-carrier-protein] synthase 3 protein 2 [Staphylococcus aureus VET1833R]EZV31955.1 3-oxoacyl-[acyl-carrier-protein] synthase 3 protein 2 [Staphylococcus aureus 14(11MN_17-08-66-05)]KAC55924.1 3-oxoacyl-[acyl-carrier-protein] synthase 3 protein 2 [Staphylococcus aureus VET0247R]KAE81829.1 3-oxoacyl-[acyl-carrier-protein] synthase 3 protein 2 [Staphylococcus aureus VET0401R]KAH19231.1 3-oxoacyl-[acyl-carrier-protein] synthase 3 protein 2 [Staphylococcus aureus VET1832R]CAC840274
MNYFRYKQFNNEGYIVQNGRGVYKWAVGNIPNFINETLDKANLKTTDINWFVPHSANARMIESICEKSKIPKEKALMSLKKFGNTSSATIPLSIDLATKERKLKNGD